MKLPAFVVGTEAAVKRACRARAKRLARGEAWADVIGDERVDTADFDGAIVLDRSFTRWSGVHAHVHMVFDAIFELPRTGASPEAVTPRDIAERALDSALSDAATLPCLLGTSGGVVFIERAPIQRVTPEIIVDRHIPFLRAMLRDWDALWSAGPRYTKGREPAVLTEHLTTITFVLSNCGIDPRHVVARLKREGFPALAREVLERHTH